MSTINTSLAQEGQEDAALLCDLCGQSCPDPWHYSTATSKHQHACDACWTTAPAAAAGPAARKVFLVATGETSDGAETYTRHDDAPPPMCDAECLYTTPAAPALEAPAALGGTPMAVTPEMRSAFRRAYRECGFWNDRLDYALDQMLAAAPQAPAAPTGLPSGWVPCILTHDGQHPEEVAYGPQIMMDRLKMWLGRFFETLSAPAELAVDADGEAFRTAACLGLTLRFYGGCAQSGMPGSSSVYEVASGSGRAAAMREAVQLAARAAAKNGGAA